MWKLFLPWPYLCTSERRERTKEKNCAFTSSKNKEGKLYSCSFLVGRIWRKGYLKFIVYSTPLFAFSFPPPNMVKISLFFFFVSGRCLHFLPCTFFSPSFFLTFSLAIFPHPLFFPQWMWFLFPLFCVYLPPILLSSILSLPGWLRGQTIHHSLPLLYLHWPEGCHFLLTTQRLQTTEQAGAVVLNYASYTTSVTGRHVL